MVKVYAKFDFYKELYSPEQFTLTGLKQQIVSSRFGNSISLLLLAIFFFSRYLNKVANIVFKNDLKIKCIKFSDFGCQELLSLRLYPPATPPLWCPWPSGLRT